MGFQTPQLGLTELLASIGKGEVQLPDFQRAYKWDDDRIRSLLVTVLRGHPLGALMLLDTGNENVRFKPQALARVADDAATHGKALVEPQRLLLDGQQRMTSLYQALTGSGVVGTKDARGKELARRYYLDLELALGDPADQEAAVRSLPADGIVRENFGQEVLLDVSTRELQVEQGLMPFTVIFSDETLEWLMAYIEAGTEADDVSRKAIVKEINERVVKAVSKYLIPAIQLDKDTTKEAVATVFEKVNSGGLPLNNFELLTAIFAGDADYYAEHGDYFRLREDWNGTTTVLDQHPVLADVKSTDFLQAVLLLSTLERRRVDVAAGKAKPTAVSARGEDTLKVTLSEYLTWAPRVRAAMPWVAHFYAAQHIHTAGLLPYRTQTVPLAVFRVLLGEHIDQYAIAARIRRWYWSGVLGELYGSTTETRFARDVEQVPVWARAGDDVATPNTLQDANFLESRLLSLRTRGSAAYKGVYALLMTKQCKDWKLDQHIDHATYLDQQIDIHHVFPRAWCEKNSIDPDRRESIINKTPLAKKTNIFLRGESPALYLPRLERDTGMAAEHVDAILHGHLVDPRTLREADFDAYFRLRRAALVGLIGDAMGKAVMNDVIEHDGAIEGLEAPDAFEAEPEDSEALDSQEPDDEPDSLDQHIAGSDDQWH